MENAQVSDDRSSTLEVLDLVAASPGLTRAVLARRLGGRRSGALARIAAAVEQGRLREGPTQVSIRAGGTRTTVGLYPASTATAGPTTTGSTAAAPAAGAAVVDLDGARLRMLRQRAGVSVVLLADHLGVSARQLHRWESGEQALPPRPHLRQALTRAQMETLASVIRSPGRRAAVRELVREVRHSPGVGRLELVGRSRVRVQLLREALEDGLVHVAPTWRPGASRAVAGVYPGVQLSRSSDQVLVAALRRAREGAGWSQAATATRLGITRTTLQRWEEQLVHVPAWAGEVASSVLLDARRARRDLTAALLAAVDADPGVSRKTLARRLGYARQDGAVREALQPLLDLGAVHERHAGRHGQQGGLFPGPAPVEVLTPEALRQRREALGLLQREVAERVGVAETVYQPWEWGTRPMSLEMQHRLLDELEMLAPTSPREQLRMVLLEAVRAGDGGRYRLHDLARSQGVGARRTVVDGVLAELEQQGLIHRGRASSGEVDRRGRSTPGRLVFLPGPRPAG